MTEIDTNTQPADDLVCSCSGFVNAYLSDGVEYDLDYDAIEDMGAYSKAKLREIMARGSVHMQVTTRGALDVRAIMRSHIQGDVEVAAGVIQAQWEYSVEPGHPGLSGQLQISTVMNDFRKGFNGNLSLKIDGISGAGLLQHVWHTQAGRWIPNSHGLKWDPASQSHHYNFEITPDSPLVMTVNGAINATVDGLTADMLDVRCVALERITN